MASSPNLSSSEASGKSEHETSPSCSPTPLALNQHPAGSTSNNPPPVRASAHKKDKKNVREKRRRGELNRKFETLRELLAIGEGKAKVEKSHILSEAITAIEGLKKRNHELMMLVNQLNGGGSNNPQSNMNPLRANPLLPPSAALSPFLNMLPNLPINSSNNNDASIANSTLLAQMASSFRPNQNQQSPQSANQQQSVLTQPTHAFMSQLSQLGVSNPSMSLMSLNNASTNTPTPLPYGNNQPQSFPAFTPQQMSPSLAFQQQLQQQFAHQQQHHLQAMQQQQQQQQQQSMGVLNSNQPQNMLTTAQSLTRGSSHASLNDPHAQNNQQQHRQ